MKWHSESAKTATTTTGTPDDVDDVDVDDGDDLDGPFDVEDFDDPAAAAVGRLDLGSVLIPMPEAGQVAGRAHRAWACPARCGW